MRPLDREERDFYVQSLEALNRSGVPYLVGGAYCLPFYTGVERHTKDLDIFILERDRERILAVLAAQGSRTETTYPHWLSKAFDGDHFIDIIHSSGNGVSMVDEEWFAHAMSAMVLEVPVKLCPVEETIWSKAFVQERERYDGADVAHLIQARGASLDWPRLLRRFGPHWRVLLAHLILFGFVYPSQKGAVPDWVLEELLERARSEIRSEAPGERICQGSLLSREQYMLDIEAWGYTDARLQPLGHMTRADVSEWTAAIDNPNPH